jgi:hypothetical protein
MDLVLSQNSINIILPAEGFSFGNDVFPFHALMFAQVHCGAATFHHL